MQVCSGQITATQAARLLGVSRKTYYEWERRGLEAMMAQLQDQPPGRPAQTSDPEVESLQKRLHQAEAKLEEARRTQELRQILDSLYPTPAKKNAR